MIKEHLREAKELFDAVLENLNAVDEQVDGQGLSREDYQKLEQVSDLLIRADKSLIAAEWESVDRAPEILEDGEGAMVWLSDGEGYEHWTGDAWDAKNGRFIYDGEDGMMVAFFAVVNDPKSI